MEMTVEEKLKLRKRERNDKFMETMDDVIRLHRHMESYLNAATVAARLKNRADLITHAQEMHNLCDAMISSLREITNA